MFDFDEFLFRLSIRDPRAWTKAFAAFVLGFLLFAAALQPANAAEIPDLANRMRRDVVRLSQVEFGLDGRDYAALIGAQVHQESRWNPNAKSPVGAAGLMQIMPATSTWLSKTVPALGKSAPYDPRWSLAAGIEYDRQLFTQFKVYDSPCDHWGLVLLSYNRGIGHITKQQKDAANSGSWRKVASKCYGSAANCRESGGYPEAILNKWLPLYLGAGWEGERICPNG